MHLGSDEPQRNQERQSRRDAADDNDDGAGWGGEGINISGAKLSKLNLEMKFDDGGGGGGGILKKPSWAQQQEEAPSSSLPANKEGLHPRERSRGRRWG